MIVPPIETTLQVIHEDVVQIFSHDNLIEQIMSLDNNIIFTVSVISVGVVLWKSLVIIYRRKAENLI